MRSTRACRSTGRRSPFASCRNVPVEIVNQGAKLSFVLEPFGPVQETRVERLIVLHCVKGVVDVVDHADSLDAVAEAVPEACEGGLEANSVGTLRIQLPHCGG